MMLLVVFFVSLVVGQAISIALGLMVERLVSPYAGLVTFIACYFAMFSGDVAFCGPRHQSQRGEQRSFREDPASL
jgi:hypothetical protein